ncbi:MAG: MgtC/SapB family protein [Clostridiales bacterium]|nr:MgtC/SapB family protein [Candidatus Crickella merdequi]
MLNTVHTIAALTDGEILIRLLISVVVGGVIGLERGKTRRPAGFRTHMLVCVGSCVVMMTNLFLYTSGLDTDPARLGAQVITGVGFLGAGSILLTTGNRVKGLTTAAGLWASACLGLAIGAGFYVAAVVGSILVFLSLTLFHQIENQIYNLSRTLNLYIETVDYPAFRALRRELREQGVEIQSFEFESDTIAEKNSIGLTMTLKLAKGIAQDDLISDIKRNDGVLLVEEV